MKNYGFLIVEDDKNVSALTSMMLRSMGYNVTSIAVSSVEALSEIKKKKPDLVLMDIMIEGDVDGIDTAVIVRKEYGIPVIFITAFSDNQTLERAKEAEPFAYLIKPFTKEGLKSTIEIALKKYELESRLKENELLFRTTLNSISDGVITTDENENIKFMNPVAEILTGYKLNEVINKKLESVYSTVTDLSVEGLVYLYSESPENFRTALMNNKYLVSRNGRKIPIEEKISPIQENSGSCLGRVITIKDMTQKREALLNAKAAKDYYLDLFEKFPVFIWRANKDGNFNYFNNHWLEFTGRDINDEIMEGWFEDIHPDDRQGFIGLFKASFEKREKFETEIRLRSLDNSYHWLICFCNPLFDLKNNFDGYVGLGLDIDNRKRLEEELKLAKMESDASSQAKSTFISNMSHELRTPLNGIMGVSDLLLDTNLDVQQRELLDLLKQAAATLLNLLNNLLDFAKLEHGDTSLDESVFDLKSLASEILSDYSCSVGKSGIEVTCDCNEYLPEKLVGDKVKIRKVLTNLLSNAFKFTEKGYVKLVINAEEVTHSGVKPTKKTLVHFKVMDSGIGIPSEKLNAVFESFTQVDPSKTRKYSGSGLGLTIVKRLVEAMHGKMWIKSEPGAGTEFNFVLELKTNPKKTLMKI